MKFQQIFYICSQLKSFMISQYNCQWFCICFTNVFCIFMFSTTSPEYWEIRIKKYFTNHHIPTVMHKFQRHIVNGKPTTYGLEHREDFSTISSQNQSSASLKLRKCIYQTWKLVTWFISEDKYWMPCQRELLWKNSIRK